jgi:hypothetical protein
MTFAQAVDLRDELERRGWPRDLLGIEAYGSNIATGRAVQGHRVVLAWADGRFTRVTSLEAALRFLPGAGTLPGTASEPPGGKSRGVRGLRHQREALV